jgi:hypothetical protein
MLCIAEHGTEMTNSNGKIKTATATTCARCGDSLQPLDGGFWRDSLGNQKMCVKCLEIMIAKAKGGRR